MDKSVLNIIVEEAMNSLLGSKNLLNGICSYLTKNDSIDVYDGENEIDDVVVGGESYNIFFDADVDYSMTDEGYEATYDYPAYGATYEGKVNGIYNVAVYTEDGEEIEELHNNDILCNAILKNSYADVSGMEFDYDEYKYEPDYDARRYDESIEHGTWQKKYEYVTDLIDYYGNLTDDGHILSGDQMRQLSDAVEWLEDTNAHDSENVENWINLGKEILDRYDGRGSGRSFPIPESVTKEMAKLITEGLTEGRTVEDDGTVEVDNFDKIRSMLQFKGDGDTLYFVYIQRRKKDNPYMRESREFVKEYYFKNLKEFDASIDEIRNICKTHNARAYIYLNARSSKTVDKWTEINNGRFRRHHTMGEKFQWNAKSLAAGRSLDEPDRPLCFIDIDSSDMNDIKTAMKIIRSSGIKPLYAYRSLNNGLHVILPDKDAAKKLDFTPINGDLNGLSQFAKNNAKVSVEIDKPVLLYAALKPNGYDKQYARMQKFMANNKPRK